MRWKYIAVEGPIGVGKTTFVNLMVEKLGATKILESVENPFLKSFYDDETGAAFQVQLFFLLTRYQRLAEVAQADLFSQLMVADFTLQKDRIFAYLNLTDSELQIYEKLYSLLAPQVPKPDMVVYLQGSTDVLVERVRRRDLDAEANIQRAYLDEVSRAYSHFFYHYKDTPLLVINTSDIDIVTQQDDLDDLIEQIVTMDRGTCVYVPRHAR